VNIAARRPAGDEAGPPRPDRTLPATVAGIAALAVACQLDPDARAHFGWDASRAWLEPWRLVSCHFVHLGARHLLANLAALLLLAWVASRHRAGPSFALGGFAAAAAVSLGIAAGPVPIAWYVGLSGMLYGIFAREALRLAQPPARRRWLGAALYLAGLAKVVADLRLGVGSMGALGIPLAPPAHLYGYLGGTLAALPALWRARHGPAA